MTSMKSNNEKYMNIMKIPFHGVHAVKKYKAKLSKKNVMEIFKKPY